MTDTKPIGETTGHYQAVLKDTLVFDSHGYVKRMTDGGFNEHQAEALAAEQGDLLSNLATRQDMEAVREDIETINKNMATKEELREVKDDIETIKKNMVTKEELEEVKKNMATKDELKSEIAGLEARLVKWMVGSLFVFAGLIIALG